MRFTVQYMRYFEDLGFDDYDTKEFESLNEAYGFYTALKNEGKNASLWQGWLGDNNFCKLH